MVSSIPTGLFPSGASKSFEETEMFRGTTMSTMDDPHQAGCPRHLGHTCYYLHICASVSEWEFLFYVLQLRQQLPLSFVIIFSLFIAPTAPPTLSQLSRLLLLSVFSSLWCIISSRISVSHCLMWMSKAHAANLKNVYNEWQTIPLCQFITSVKLKDQSLVERPQLTLVFQALDDWKS